MEEKKIVLQNKSIENSWIKESMRTLRNKLVINADKNKVLCVSSLFPKEGVSTIVRMLALYLSDINKKVIVVCTNLKHKDNEYPTSVFTLKDYLSGTCAFESIVQNINDYFSIIVGSSLDEDHSDLLYLDSFTNLIEQLKSDYDFVLIDSPSFSIASEALVLSRIADALIMIVKENNVKITEFSEFCNKLSKLGITIKGVVLNQVSETENLEINVI